MTVLQRIQREPVLLTGVVVAAVGLATILGLDPVVGGGIVTFAGAVIALMRSVVTPSSEVVVQERPSGRLVAGAAAIVPTGDALSSVGLAPLDGQAIIDAARSGAPITEGQYRARPVKRDGP